MFGELAYVAEISRRHIERVAIVVFYAYRSSVIRRNPSFVQLGTPPGVFGVAFLRLVIRYRILMERYNEVYFIGDFESVVERFFFTDNRQHFVVGLVVEFVVRETKTVGVVVVFRRLNTQKNVVRFRVGLI